MKTTKGDILEAKIIEAAKQLFIENGYAETSMSDIAAQVGINRPVLHYYFRTKDRMFRAVFGNIVLSFLPGLKEIILRRDLSVSDRVGRVVDAYYEGIFRDNPCLPFFIIREINRDSAHLLAAVKELGVETYIYEVAEGLKAEMAEGLISAVPLRVVFCCFYSLLVMPWLSKPLLTNVFAAEGETFGDMLAEWRPYIIRQMRNLLEVPSA